ncbi:MAG: OpgC domain-containing protein [Hyphomicrobiaceae bacterium]
MQRQVNAVDFWRGYALIAIFINHIPQNIYEQFTHKNVSLSDSAELFVFLAGWSLRHVVGKPEDPRPTSELMHRLFGRAVTLYVAQMAIALIAIAMLAAAALLLANPLFLEWHNAAAIFYDPVRAHIGLVLLSHQLGYFNILPLYVVLMMIAPLVAMLHRYAPSALLPISFTIYLASVVFAITVPTWPVSGQWFFNPLCWQLIFVLGFSMSRERGAGGWVRRNISWLRMVAVPIVVGLAVMSRFNLWWDPTKVPEPRLLFLIGKTFVTPIRLIQFLALIALLSAAYPYIVRVLPRFVDFLSRLGRNSLPVFCVGSVLSLAGQIVRFAYGGGVVVDTVLVGSGIVILSVVAWLAEWRRR